MPGAVLVAWLVERGVKLKAAHEFTKQHRCLSTDDAALLLRFELAPLHLANADAVHEDMRRLFHCGPRTARRLISDLDVVSAPSSVPLYWPRAVPSCVQPMCRVRCRAPQQAAWLSRCASFASRCICPLPIHSLTISQCIWQQHTGLQLRIAT